MYLEVGYCSFHIEMQKGSIDIQTQGLHMKVADLSGNEFAGSVDAQRELISDRLLRKHDALMN